MGCIFVHVPKAAGTSVNKALYGRTLGHYSATEIHNKFPGLYKKCFTFSMVRNPWDRALSAYRFATVGRTDSMGIHDPSQYQIPQFESFERFVLEWLQSQCVEELDFVFKPQWVFVCNDTRQVMVDHLGKVESMDRTVSVLSEKLKRKIVIGNENMTASRDEKGYCKAYVRQEMVEIVRSVYSADVEIFGYEFE
nr:sulfotransferase family 2 domain-containing protein [uncultured Halomonas sp.]